MTYNYCSNRPLRLETDTAIEAKSANNVFDDVLSTLSREHGEEIASKIVPILEINLKRGRIASWVLGSTDSLLGYVTNLTSNYMVLLNQIHKIQLDRDEHV